MGCNPNRMSTLIPISYLTVVQTGQDSNTTARPASLLQRLPEAGYAGPRATG
jgi:hypothetical protein